MSKRIGFHRMLRGFRGAGFTADARVHVDALGETRNQFGSIDYSAGNILPDVTFDVTGVLMSYSRYLNLNPNADGYDASHVLYVEQNNRFFDCDYVMFKRAVELTISEVAYAYWDGFFDTLGSDTEWTNPQNALDGNIATYAENIVLNVESRERIRVIFDPIPSGLADSLVLTSVRIEILYSLETVPPTGGDSELVFWPYINGERGDRYILARGTETTAEIDITNDSEAPPIWTYADAKTIIVEFQNDSHDSDSSSARLYKVTLITERDEAIPWTTETSGRPIFDYTATLCDMEILDTEDGLYRYYASDVDAELDIFVDKMAVKNVEEVDEHYMALFLGAWS